MEAFGDRNGYSAAILMDLSKAFDTINHDLLIEKLHACGVHGRFLKLLRDYVWNRFQRIEVISAYSTCEELCTGIP